MVEKKKEERKLGQGRQVDYEFICSMLEEFNAKRKDFRKSRTKLNGDIVIAKSDSILSRRDFISRSSKMLDLFNRMSKERSIRYQMVNLENGWNVLIEPGDEAVSRLFPDTKEDDFKLVSRKSIRLSGSELEALPKDEFALMGLLSKLAYWLENPSDCLSKTDFNGKEKTCLSLYDVMRPLNEARVAVNPSLEDPVLPETSIISEAESTPPSSSFLLKVFSK